MKDYIVRYSYNHGWIESETTISAENENQAREKAEQYTITRVISVKEKKPSDIIEIDGKTIEYICGVLETQRGYIKKNNSGKLIGTRENTEQAAYYRGMRAMFEMILTGGYTKVPANMPDVCYSAED